MIEVIGLGPLLANLGRIGAELGAEGTRDAEMAAAEHLRDAWVANIESEGLVDTGRYRDSITVIDHDGHLAAYTDVPYAPLLEHGTSRMGPHPVAERALDEDAEEATAAAGEKLGDHL